MDPTQGHDERLMPSILVVDDDEGVLECLDLLLKRAGYSVTTADSGEQALALTQAGHTFDLLLTDFMMPGMNGIELARCIRATLPNQRVAIITGFAAQSHADEVDAYIEKPVLPSKLLKTIRALLGVAT
jgi:CheY-like chemotaxis protein